MTNFVDDPGAPQATLTETRSLSVNLIPTPDDPGAPAGEDFNFYRVLSSRGLEIPPLAESVIEDDTTSPIRKTTPATSRIQ